MGSIPIYAPQAEVIGHLAAAFATHDPARITYAFRAMGNYGMPAADIVESSVNAMGYRLLENGEIDAESSNAVRMIEQMMSDKKLSYASGNKS